MINKKFFFLGMVAFLIIYLLFWPVSIDPVSWKPNPAPKWEGNFIQNNQLARIQKIGKGIAHGPEDLAIDAQGNIYGGTADGSIIRFSPDGSSHQVIANTQGRPLGLKFDQIGNLIVADAFKGLLSITPQGQITVLTTQSDGLPFKFTDDLDIALDGTIYFSDASFKFDQKNYKADILENRPNGRLLSYNPTTKETKLLLKDLYFANGVAISPDQSFVLVVETSRYRVRRLWLTGEKQGQTDIFIDNLPAFPDGISCNGKDRFWLALISPRDPGVDLMLPYPFLRKILMRLPESMLPKPKRHAFALGLDLNGKITHNLQDPAGSYAQISNVVEYENSLYFGSLEDDGIGHWEEK